MGLWSLLSGPVHPSSVGPLEPAVETSPFLFWCVSGACVGTSSSLFWWASGACCRDQFIPILVGLWCLLSGPVHTSSGGPLMPAVGISSSLFCWASGACHRDQSIPLLVGLWCLLSGPVHPSSGGLLVPVVGTSSSIFLWASDEIQLQCSPASATILSAKPKNER